MKAFVYSEYGNTEVLQFKEVEKPEPKDNEVLVKIHAASINASDNEFLTGSPLYIRGWGLTKPGFNILGSDIAGTVEKAGKDVKQFKPGDEVFGDIMDKWGGFAEYVEVEEKKLTLKPDWLSFEEAAAIPQAALVAYQGLQRKRSLSEGQKVLINGAGGGSGSFAIQLAKMHGAIVTGVDNAFKLGKMQQLGADFVIDYQKQDFTKSGEKYDLIIDFVASHSIFDYRRRLKSNGIYTMVGGKMKHIFQTGIIGSLITSFSKKSMGILGAIPNKDLLTFIELIRDQKIKVIIDRVFPLKDLTEAFNYFKSGKAFGKVVIKISE